MVMGQAYVNAMTTSRVPFLPCSFRVLGTG